LSDVSEIAQGRLLKQMDIVVILGVIGNGFVLSDISMSPDCPSPVY
jgi:hypothetical protein